MRFGNPSKKSKTHVSLKGHSVTFPGRGTLKESELPPGAKLGEDGTVYVFVPPILHSEVLNAGFDSEEEIAETDEVRKPAKPEDPEKLKAAAYDAFDKMVAAAQREDFSGNGTPKAQAIEKVLGYALNNAEIKDLWGKYVIDRASAST